MTLIRWMQLPVGCKDLLYLIDGAIEQEDTGIVMEMCQNMGHREAKEQTKLMTFHNAMLLT